MPRKITNNDIQKRINSLSINEIITILDNYSKETGNDISSSKEKLIIEDLQNHLLNNNINSCCPKCSSHNIVKNGKRNNLIVFKCKDCNKTFTLFSKTILEKTKYSWEVWVKMIEMTLNNIPMEHMQEVLVKDFNLAGINYKTVFLWKHKIINTLANMPMPKLKGIIQIDETFFRESQKGSRNLESTIKGEKRVARYGRRPSKYGVMGNEFANVVCAVDLNGYVVSKVIGLGKLTVETFVDLFDDYLDNPSYICSDGNSVYKDYCNLKNIPLYIKPSNYLTTLQKNGYETIFYFDTDKQEMVEKTNEKILTKLYYEKAIDYIFNREDLTYKEFSEIKNANSLSLARVNQFHSELKRHFECNTKGVSTKYLADYIGFYTFIRNWKTSNNHYPSSSKDAESILIDILKGKTTYTITNIKNAKLDLPKTSDKYMHLLKEKTKEIRKLTKNPYFKYDEEDNAISFNKRDFLYDIPQYKLNKLCSKYNIPKKWAKYSKISELLKKDDINQEIMLLINDSKHYQISQEDMQALNDLKYAM